MIRRDSDIEIHLPDAGASQTTDTPDERDIEMLSDDQNQALSLPPHIAARFYRKSGSARRASATSSRRSSISSLHSHHSSVSAHGGSHSDHVAQHLRRASIIESRKARLADRAAHAEKVRLRAALAKAATRNLQREERALAAQQARERLLAEITAKCEEEVRRAKKKAEDNREMKAAKYARLRLEMAAKFAEAEKRRLLYQQSQRRQRTSGSSVGEEKTTTKTVVKKSLTRDAAARIIQRAWRNHHTRVVMKSFRSLNLSLERVQGMAFDDVGALLSEEVVLDTMAKVLRLCGLQDMEGGTMGERGAVRTFLSSFLILAHPSQVLSSNGEQEQDLIAKARDLLVSFEQVTALLSAGYRTSAITSELQGLCEAYTVFFSAFHAWKAHDSTVLIEIMLAQFVELELIWQTVKDDRDGGVADDYQQGIRHNQILLLAKLKRLAGPDKAMDMVRQALRKAKREKKRSASSKQVIPRSASVPPSSSAEAHTESVPSPISETFNNVESAALQELDKQRISPHESFTKALTALPENRVLVHELLINKEFKIDQAPYTEPRQQIMKHMCDMMRKDVEAGLGTNWTVAMATVIQDRLLRSLRPGNSLHVLISEVLDPKLIENQCKAGTFSYDAFFDFMSTILPKLCAPFRDPEVKAFAEDKSGDAIDRLARLMGIIDLLSLDHTNFMIQVAAPQLIQEAPGYEQRTFERGLEDGSIKLDRTRRFWRTNRNLLIDEMKRRDPENGNADPQPPVAKIYAQGLVDLVLSNAAVSPDLIPETLDLDRERLERLHAKAFKIVATASILLTAKNLLKRDVRSQWKAEAEHIVSLDFADIKPERVQSIIESTHPMPAAARSQLSATIRRVLAPVATASAAAESSVTPQTSVEVFTGTSLPTSSDNSQASAQSASSNETNAAPSSFSDPVARLILSRLRAHVLTRLSASSASERVRATTTASQSLAAAGMPEFVSEVGKLVDELARVREVDWICHGVFYERIWNEETPQKQE
ncbi:hypothetical protein VTN77DRAFT_3031 [Rasamsonia byssochlamydoides]|uniref:uncharacterized protein n=1 Tax=Rasamsonia byssochlamydoides TaxID=89139 RepID=UPI003743DA93